MVYSDDQYGLVRYGDDTAAGDEQEIEEKHYLNIKRYLPPFMWQDFREMDALLDAQGYEIGRFREELNENFKQTYVDSATWGLRRWEAVLGINASASQTYETRRAAIKARLVACAVCTPALLAEIATRTTGVDAIVVEDTENYQFTIYFIGKYGVPPNVGILRDVIELIKPAHLLAQYQYRYVIWKDLLNYSWGAAKAYTWESLRVNETASYVSWRGANTAGFTWRSVKKYTWKSLKKVAEAKG